LQLKYQCRDAKKIFLLLSLCQLEYFYDKNIFDLIFIQLSIGYQMHILHQKHTYLVGKKVILELKNLKPKKLHFPKYGYKV